MHDATLSQSAPLKRGGREHQSCQLGGMRLLGQTLALNIIFEGFDLGSSAGAPDEIREQSRWSGPLPFALDSMGEQIQ